MKILLLLLAFVGSAFGADATLQFSAPQISAIASGQSFGTGTVVSVGASSSDFAITGGPVTTTGTITLNLNTSGIGAGTYSGVTLNTKGIATAGTIRSFNNAPGRSTIVTVAAAANGFQVSSTRDSSVRYAVTIVTTASISGSASGYVVLEVAATNSVTAGDWVEIGRITSGQAVSVVLALQSVLTSGSGVGGMVPAGYYARLRSVNTNGTPTYTYNSGQEVLL